MKRFVSTANYYPGRTDLPAGTVFTEDEWVAAGGKAAGLAEHVAKGYITEAVQTKPPAPKPAPVEEEAPVVEEEAPVVEETKKEPPTGLWSFTAEELEPLPIEALNTMYKDTAKKAGLPIPRAFNNKESLIKKMTSEGPDKV